MVYKKEFIAVVKCGGKILREIGDAVQIPFGSEYTLLLKNKSSRKAVVDVEIDGQDVLNGRQLIVEPNSDVELEGFLRDNVARNKFRFIQKTDKIVEHRGDRVDDGLIRVEFRYEKAVVEQTITKTYWEPQPCFYPTYPYRRRRNDGEYWWGSDTTIGSTLFNSTTDTIKGMGVVNCSYSANVAQDEGITVKGSEVNQSFNSGHTKELSDNSEVIILRLLGVKGDKVVTKPLTVVDRQVCETCGTKSKGAKFCDNCGTALL